MHLNCRSAAGSMESGSDQFVVISGKQQNERIWLVGHVSAGMQIVRTIYCYLFSFD